MLHKNRFQHVVVATNFVCYAQTLSVSNVDITAQARLPEIDVGEALGVLKISFLAFFELQKPSQHNLRPWMAPEAALNRFSVSRRDLPVDRGSLGRAQGCHLPTLEDPFDHL